MATPTRAKLLTADEFDLLPERSPEGGKMELVEGRVVTMAPVGPPHGGLQVRIAARLLAFADARRLGRVYVEVGYRLRSSPDEPHTIRVPDVSFFSEARYAASGSPRRGTISGAPDLAVEVMSPDDGEEDVHRKVEQYLAAGCTRVWVVRPDIEDVTVHRPGGDSHTFHHGDTLGSEDAGFGAGGFALPLAELFA